MLIFSCDALRLNLELNGAPQQAVGQLVGVVAPALQHVGHVLLAEVADADDAYLALALQVKQGRHRVGEGARRGWASGLDTGR